MKISFYIYSYIADTLGFLEIRLIESPTIHHKGTPYADPLLPSAQFKRNSLLSRTSTQL